VEVVMDFRTTCDAGTGGLHALKPDAPAGEHRLKEVVQTRRASATRPGLRGALSIAAALLLAVPLLASEAEARFGGGRGGGGGGGFSMGGRGGGGGFGGGGGLRAGSFGGGGFRGGSIGMIGRGGGGGFRGGSIGMIGRGGGGPAIRSLGAPRLGAARLPGISRYSGRSISAAGLRSGNVAGLRSGMRGMRGPSIANMRSARMGANVRSARMGSVRRAGVADPGRANVANLRRAGMANVGRGQVGNMRRANLKMAAAGAGGLAGAAALRGQGRPASVRHSFGNRSLANAAFKSHAGHAHLRHGKHHHGHFHGHFHRKHGHFHHHKHWPWWHRGIVIGWVGPVFWPYAYDDFFDYVFWPYAYDDFWPYAYEDVYYGIYGGYGYVDQGVGVRASPGARTTRARTVRALNGAGSAGGGVCGEQAPELTNWPIESISEVVQPTDAQRPLLTELKDATAKAVEILRASCPTDLPSIPTGRLAAMESRLQVMLDAVQTVRGPLDQFYQSLTDEQKERFNVVAPTDTAASQDRRDLTRLCTERGPGVADLPIDRIAQAVRPDDVQRAALEELRAASTRAGEGLKADCPTYRALTPTGRVEAMQQRLEAMLTAVRTVQPALAKFYDGLSDEQKARFNAISARRTGA
jgi:hypothetical protein